MLLKTIIITFKTNGKKKVLAKNKNTKLKEETNGNLRPEESKF